ncbi:uncharacterized protein LOC141848947 [Brevipalpus obovatus]|uniref:uncharacterized protein LOC141848947 n=1 Tax=Brevipalpus obovatus TaxID=246614 RepID=UPI003D9E80DB
MDIVLLPSHIIQRIFDFLEPRDVYRCRYVCKTFHHEASQWLTRCPPIDAFQSVLRLISTDGGSIFERKTPENERIEEEIFVKNAGMNQDPGGIAIRPKRLAWWYLKRRNNFRHLPRHEVDKALKSFFQEDMHCVPSFSFILSDFRPGLLMPSNSFRYPTIALILCYDHLELDDEIFRTPLQTLLDIPKDTHLSEHLKSSIKPYIEAIHINRFASDHKVILTDWFDPGSMRPNLDDPEYPVKAFMFFSGYPGKNIPENFHQITQFLKGCNFPVMPVFDVHILLYVNPAEDLKLPPPRIISVAFAGKQIKSAMHVFHEYANELEFSQQVLEFKNSLDFRTDDGRVLGFLAHAAGPIYDPIGKYAYRLIEIFKSVKFVNIQMLNVMRHLFGSTHPSILLIRI